MKRVCAILLVLALVLLSACATQPESSSAPAGEDGTTTSASNGLSAGTGDTADGATTGTGQGSPPSQGASVSGNATTGGGKKTTAGGVATTAGRPTTGGTTAPLGKPAAPTPRTNAVTVTVEAESGRYPSSCQLVDTHTKGKSVGYTSKGNTYTYHVDCQKSGYYILSVTASTYYSVDLTVELDGEHHDELPLELTGDWDTYRTTDCLQAMYLSAGTHSLSFTQSGDGMNFDRFSLVYLAERAASDLPNADVKARFTGDRVHVGYSVPLSVTGLSGSQRVVRYIWRTAGGFFATEAPLTVTAMDAPEMTHTHLWVVISAGGKSYFTYAKTLFIAPEYDPLPVISIQTADPITSKEDYVTGQMMLVADAPESQLYDGEIEIRGRGNATWIMYDKKPYKIKLDSKADLLGMGKNKHWVLLANHRDRALTRNQLAFDFSEHLGLNTPQGRFVRLLLNGEDMGIYQLCEQVRVDETRVDIFDWEDEAEEETDLSGLTAAKGYDLTGGLLLEINGYYDEVSKFTTQKLQMPITVKAPEYLYTNGPLFRYAQDYLNDFEAAITSPTFRNGKGQHYSDLFDAEDLAKYWLLNEFMGNLDSGTWSSTYMYKDIGGDKMHMGPAWDYDSSAGNYFDHSLQCPADKWVETRQGKWYIALYKDRTFVERLYNLYKANRSYLDRLVAQAESYYAVLYADARYNHERWGVTTSYEYEGHLLVDWMRARLAFMDKQFQSVDTAYASLNKTK